MHNSHQYYNLKIHIHLKSIKIRRYEQKEEDNAHLSEQGVNPYCSKINV